MADSPTRPVRLPGVDHSTPSPATPERVLPAAEPINGDIRQAKARLVSMKTALEVEPAAPIAESARWLPTTTADARFDQARRHLSEAMRAYDVRAWLSAEDSAWDAISASAEAIDLARRESGLATPAAQTATAQLRLAHRAIVEARDFARWSSPGDAEAIARTARSHVTTVLHGVPSTGLTSTEAVDRYLDAARVALSDLAAQSIEAAQAMDLLAATLLTRGEPKQLPQSTSLCLRRAALKGQPQNASLAFRLGAQLAEIGLLKEAQWALEHSLTLQPNADAATVLASVLRRSGQADAAQHLLASYRYPTTIGTVGSSPKVPHITQLSPEQFASVSPPVMTEPAQPPSTPVQMASARGEPQAASAPNTSAEANDDRPGMIRSFFGSLRRVW